MRVQLDIFSGRPNPEWELGADEIERIEAMLADLPELVPISRPADEPLGYRGFRILDPGRERTVIVRGGTVEIRSARGVTTVQDEYPQLEQALVEIARVHVEPDVYRFLQSQRNT